MACSWATIWRRKGVRWDFMGPVEVAGGGARISWVLCFGLAEGAVVFEVVGAAGVVVDGRLMEDVGAVDLGG